MTVPADAPILTVAQMRAAEDSAFASGISQETLMERAGLAVAREVARFAFGRAILVLAGPGNNGGDAHLAARHLAAWGHDVIVATLGATIGETAAAMRDRWAGDTVPLAAAPRRPVIVDGLLGTGRVRPFDEDARATLAELRRDAAFVLAIDIASGIDADTGQGDAPLAPDITLALAALKPAHVAAEQGDHVLLLDLGIPIETKVRTIARPAPSHLPRNANKFTRGMVVVIGGAMPGAGALAASAALHGGAGYVVLVADEADVALPNAVIRRHPDDLATILDDPRIGALLIGPGLGRDDRAHQMLDAALASPHPLVLDGDALTLLGTDAAATVHARTAPTCLTPHVGEFDRMFPGEGTKIARTLAAAHAADATVIHKGADTVIAHPDGTATIDANATPWLSTAGSGDVLAGLVAARLARDATAGYADTAVWLHTRAAALATPGFAADDLIDRCPIALAEFERP